MQPTEDWVVVVSHEDEETGEIYTTVYGPVLREDAREYADYIIHTAEVESVGVQRMMPIPAAYITGEE